MRCDTGQNITTPYHLTWLCPQSCPSHPPCCQNTANRNAPKRCASTPSTPSLDHEMRAQPARAVARLLTSLKRKYSLLPIKHEYRRRGLKIQSNGTVYTMPPSHHSCLFHPDKYFSSAIFFAFTIKQSSLRELFPEFTISHMEFLTPIIDKFRRRFIELSNKKVRHDVTGSRRVKSSEYVCAIFSSMTEDDTSSGVSPPATYVVYFTFDIK